MRVSMVVGDQSEAIEFLRSRASGVELISTHISMIFLTDNCSFKLKRAVMFPYLDFSTPEQRLACCKAELELNRRTAPQLYLGIHTITRNDDGSLTFDGTGALVDAVVEMRRFSQCDLFDTMAREGRLSTSLMTSLAIKLQCCMRAILSAKHPWDPWRSQPFYPSIIKRLEPHRSSTRGLFRNSMTPFDRLSRCIRSFSTEGKRLRKCAAVTAI